MSEEPHQRQGDTATIAPPSRPGPFTALQHRDFRFLLIGGFVGTLGQQMQTVAITYQVYQFHHSAFELGLLGLFRLLPVLVFSLAGGVIADQVDRRTLLLATQPALLCCTLALIVTTATGWASIGVMYLIAAIIGMLSTVDSPARSAILPALVPRAHLANALSWNITIAEVATITGPALGGVAIGAIGIAGTYGCEAFSFVVVILALLGMHVRLGAAASDGPRGWRAAVEGLSRCVEIRTCEAGAFVAIFPSPPGLPGCTNFTAPTYASFAATIFSSRSCRSTSSRPSGGARRCSSPSSRTRFFMSARPD